MFLSIIKNFSAVLFGIITTGLTIAIITLLNNVTSLKFHSLMLLFILPVGPLIVGFASASGFSFGQKLLRVKVRGRDYLIGMLLAFIGYYGIFYASYLTFYITNDGKVNHWFRGEHISAYSMQDDGMPVTFRRYMQFEKAHKKFGGFLTVGRHGVIPFSFTGWRVTSVILYYYQILAAIAGGLAAAIIVGDEKYCERCKRYYRKKKLRIVDGTAYVALTHDLTSLTNDARALYERIQQAPAAQKKAVFSGAVVLRYCPRCFDGSLLLQLKKETEYTSSDIEKAGKEFILSVEVIKTLISMR